jgi:glycosyltransferase involved in cell wall biosynthesis
MTRIGGLMFNNSSERLKQVFSLIKTAISLFLILAVFSFSTVHPSVITPPEVQGLLLQVESFFDDLSAEGRPYRDLKNRTAVEIGMLSSMLARMQTGEQPGPFPNLNAALDSMYARDVRERMLNIKAPPGYTGTGRLYCDAEITQGPNKGRMVRVVSGIEGSRSAVESPEAFFLEEDGSKRLDKRSLILYSEGDIPEPVFAGIHLQDESIYINIIDGDREYFEELPFSADEDAMDAVIRRLISIEETRNLKLVASGISGLDRENTAILGSRLWAELDSTWQRVASMGTNYLQITRNNAEHVNNRYVRRNGLPVVQPRLDPDTREVLTEQLVVPEDYMEVTDEEEWQIYEDLIRESKELSLKLLFFNSTVRGGGVAIMRHSGINLMRAMDIDAHWHVLSDDNKAIFEMTKNKFHNVFQNVSHLPAEEQFVTEEEFELYLNFIRRDFREKFEGCIKKANVIVIDDYQPSGLIPLIKEVNPGVKIIYRSHIQMRSDLIDKEGTPQYHNWNMIWNMIKDHIDIFISHPIDDFVPANVLREKGEKVVFLPPKTDELDGLNKELSRGQMSYYISMFNRHLEMNGQKGLDLDRPYIFQKARFDPSKGIDLLLDQYRKLRDIMAEAGYEESSIPQLVIAGNEATDDPQGKAIYEKTLATARSRDFADITDDIKVAQLPHNDQMMNTLMSLCHVYEQLSTAEGYEFNVSEALNKGKPVLSFRAGGIPLQIQEGLNGFVVDEVGDTQTAAELLFKLFEQKDLYDWMSVNAEQLVKKDPWTVSNNSCLLYMANRLLADRPVPGNKAPVRRSLFEEYEGKTFSERKKRAEGVIIAGDSALKHLNNSLVSVSGRMPVLSGGSTSVDFITDLALMPADEELLEENIKTIAALVLKYCDRDNINFVFEKGFLPFPGAGGAELPAALKYDIENAPDAGHFLRELIREVRSSRKYLFKKEQAEKFISNNLRTRRTQPKTGQLQVQIPVISEELAMWMRSTGTGLEPGQYPVVLEGSSIEREQGYVLRNFDAAYTIGLLKAVIASAKALLDRDELEKEEYETLKRNLLSRLNRVYTELGKDVSLDGDTLDYLVSRDPVQRLSRAIETSLPPITVLPVDKLKELNELIRELAYAA